MTAKPALIIGSKNYSSWSLRPWLLLRQLGIDFDEIKLPLPAIADWLADASTEPLAALHEQNIP